MKPKLQAPFLKKISFSFDSERNGYPFSIPVFSDSFEVGFHKPLTIFAGENGSGKSTLLEILAYHIGFNTFGGSRNNFLKEAPDIAPIMEALKFSWLPKVNTGFFMRAESFFNFSQSLDEMAKEDPRTYSAYGGKSLNKQSHGEAFLSLFLNRFGMQGVYILDEPEAALSPEKQLAFLGILHQMARSGEAQIIMATHSPILLSVPDADVLYLNETGAIIEKSYQTTPHWSLYARFMENPEKYHKLILDDED